MCTAITAATADNVTRSTIDNLITKHQNAGNKPVYYQGRFPGNLILLFEAFVTSPGQTLNDLKCRVKKNLGKVEMIGDDPKSMLEFKESSYVSLEYDKEK